MTEGTGPDRVAVCVCTYRRPAVLGELLERLVAVAADAEGLAAVGVVVVDDDPAGSARATAERYADAFALGLDYVTSGAGNISVARNHALAHGGRRADWLALVDDDCLPDVGWIRQLVTVRRDLDADCVSGACVDVAPPGAPAWLVAEPFLDELDTGPDRAPLEIGPLKNTLVSHRFLADHGIGFEEALGHAGGEDVMFFHLLHQAGARHHHARDAVVREQVPTERATLRYQLGRRYWYGNTEAVTSIARGRSSRPRMLAGAAKLAAGGLARPLARLARRRSPQWRYALSELLRAAGRVVGALGVEVRHR